MLRDVFHHGRPATSCSDIIFTSMPSRMGVGCRVCARVVVSLCSSNKDVRFGRERGVESATGKPDPPPFHTDTSGDRAAHLRRCGQISKSLFAGRRHWRHESCLSLHRRCSLVRIGGVVVIALFAFLSSSFDGGCALVELSESADLIPQSTSQRFLRMNA